MTKTYLPCACCVNLYVCMYKVSILGVFQYFYHCLTLLVFSCLFCFWFLIKVYILFASQPPIKSAFLCIWLWVILLCVWLQEWRLNLSSIRSMPCTRTDVTCDCHPTLWQGGSFVRAHCDVHLPLLQRTTSRVQWTCMHDLIPSSWLLEHTTHLWASGKLGWDVELEWSSWPRSFMAQVHKHADSDELLGFKLRPLLWKTVYVKHKN